MYGNSPILFSPITFHADKPQHLMYENLCFYFFKSSHDKINLNIQCTETYKYVLHHQKFSLINLSNIV